MPPLIVGFIRETGLLQHSIATCRYVDTKIARLLLRENISHHDSHCASEDICNSHNLQFRHIQTLFHYFRFESTLTSVSARPEDDTLFPTRHVTEVVKALHPKESNSLNWISWCYTPRISTTMTELFLSVLPISKCRTDHSRVNLHTTQTWKFFA